MKILTAAQMAEVDRKTTESYRIPSLLLMENAGRSVVDELEKACAQLRSQRILVFCGKGNNGGDGLVVARHLRLRGASPEIVVLGDPESYRGDASINWQIVQSLGIPFRSASSPPELNACLTSLGHAHIIVDAIFGTGLSKPVGEDLRPVIEWINEARSCAFVTSVDIPSGLLADSAQIPGPAVRAHLTVTFTALKLAQVLPPAADCMGELVLASIGSPEALLANPAHQLNLIDAAQVARTVPPRKRDAHKGNYGHVYVVAGSRGKKGAAMMTAIAALRSGAGLVTAWVGSGVQAGVSSAFPELMTEDVPETAEGALAEAGCDRVLERMSQADALVIGPGLTTNPSTVALVRRLVQQSTIPVVLDADGINAFAGEPQLIRNDSGQPIVITPHPGEMARLWNVPTSDVQKLRLEIAADCARRIGCYTVLKGFQTVVATPTGDCFVNNSGNPGMATGGSGDILAGMMGRFLTGWLQRQDRDHAQLADYICAAVHLHGLAGDLALVDRGPECLTATDLLMYLPQAFKKVAG